MYRNCQYAVKIKVIVFLDILYPIFSIHTLHYCDRLFPKNKLILIITVSTAPIIYILLVILLMLFYCHKSIQVILLHIEILSP